MKYRFPKAARFRSRRDFTRVVGNSHRHVGRFICLDVFNTGDQMPRLGVTVTKKYGNSCRRNHFKRLAREAFRHCLPHLPLGSDVHIRPRKMAEQAKSADISNDIDRLLKNLLSSGIGCS